MFKSTLASTSPIALHAINAFNLLNEFQVEVKSESWGVMVTVLAGDYAGTYDYYPHNNSFIAA
tara:strand:- start:14964 stop:15152 length:189 start_codon:yes stop_codon:yes gene_type:complete